MCYSIAFIQVTTPPIKQQPYRTPVERRQKVSEMIDTMEK